MILKLAPIHSFPDRGHLFRLDIKDSLIPCGKAGHRLHRRVFMSIPRPLGNISQGPCARLGPGTAQEARNRLAGGKSCIEAATRKGEQIWAASAGSVAAECQLRASAKSRQVEPRATGIATGLPVRISKCTLIMIRIRHAQALRARHVGRQAAAFNLKSAACVHNIAVSLCAKLACSHARESRGS